jgi:hypothetical protein
MPGVISHTCHPSTKELHKQNSISKKKEEEEKCVHALLDASPHTARFGIKANAP